MRIFPPTRSPPAASSSSSSTDDPILCFLRVWWFSCSSLPLSLYLSVSVSLSSFRFFFLWFCPGWPFVLWTLGRWVWMGWWAQILAVACLLTLQILERSTSCTDLGCSSKSGRRHRRPRMSGGARRWSRPMISQLPRQCCYLSGAPPLRWDLITRPVSSLLMVSRCSVSLPLNRTVSQIPTLLHCRPTLTTRHPCAVTMQV